eukprot:comp12065_c0_seq1/m.6778 comp12065_c0_seq1/g.6778  ORF comp12065_c0_seq1/g.6778 comp12065_c0_seq1/m.6778 type:complete len:465 (-) comp12065_c0_seq1:632-2026(-)
MQKPVLSGLRRNTYVWKGFIRSLLAQPLSVIFRLLRKTLSILPGVGFAPRPGDSYVSALWLTRTLRKEGFLSPKQHVSGVKVGGLDENRGFIGAMSKLHVTYVAENGGSTRVVAPSTFVLKMSNDGRKNRNAVFNLGGHREAYFYNEVNDGIFKELAPLVPHVLYANGSAILGEYSILMLDALQENEKTVSTGVNMFFGNQVWGIPSPVDPPREPLPVLRAMYANAAKMHAMFWRDENLKKTSWLKTTPWYNGSGRGKWEAGVEYGRKCWVAAKEKVKGSDGKLVFSPEFVAIIDESFARADWGELQKHIQNPKTPFSLCHGDFHGSNMLMQNASTNDDSSLQQGLTIFDWSEVGPFEPMIDIAQTLISDVKPDIFVKHANELVRYYWETLIQQGVKESDYPFEACWEGFCRGPERWMWMFALLASFPLPENAIQYFHDQIWAFVQAFGGGRKYYQMMSVACLA